MGRAGSNWPVGGGGIPTFDPLDVTQYSPEELRADVEAASEWGTYVALHVYTPKAIRQRRRAARQQDCPEHDFPVSRETVSCEQAGVRARKEIN